jgi:hypothetical protein
VVVAAVVVATDEVVVPADEVVVATDEVVMPTDEVEPLDVLEPSGEDEDVAHSPGLHAPVLDSPASPP